VNAFHRIAEFFQQIGDATAKFPEAFNMIHSIKKEVTTMRQEFQQAFADLQAEVAAVRSNEEAAATLLDGLHTQLTDALNSSNDPTEIVSNIQSIATQLKTDTDALAAAVSANTPASPAPTPADTGSTDTGSTDTTDHGTTDTGSTDTGSTDTGTGEAPADPGTGEATDPTA
jgi:hypothetical protein